MVSEHNSPKPRRKPREIAASLVGALRKDVSRMSVDQLHNLVYKLQAQQIELQAENQELRQARDTFLDLYEFSPTGHLTLDTSGTIVTANLTASAMLGHERRDLIGKKLAQFATNESSDVLDQHIRAARSLATKQVCEIELHRADDKRMSVLVESQQRKDQRPTMRTTLTEITRLKQAEEELESLNKSLEERIAERTGELEKANASMLAEVAARRASEEFNRAVIETARTIILVLDKEGRIVRYNKYLEELSGRKLEEVQGQDWFEVFLPERERARLRELFRGAVSGMKTLGNRNPIVTTSGKEREIEWYDAPLTGPDGEEIGLLSIGQDVSDQVLLEKEILTVADEEQRRIGQQLHDDIGQELVGLKLRIDMLSESLEDETPTFAKECEKIRKAIGNTLVKVRVLSRGLIPVKVNGHEMITSLMNLSEQIREMQRIDCEFYHGPGLDDLDEETATQLFHIVQEAVTNAIKHADTQRIQIGLEIANGVIETTIGDEGTGFRAGDAMQGAGLKIMEHRAARLGGTLTVESVPGDGTIIRCRVPIVSENSPGKG